MTIPPADTSSTVGVEGDKRCDARSVRVRSHAKAAVNGVRRCGFGTWSLISDTLANTA